MASIPYMPLYIADYMADCAHLTTLEHGAYLLLIMTYWQRQKPLPNDDDHLAKIVHLSNSKFQKMKSNLKKLFSVSEHEWRHKRIERELNIFRSKSEQARLAGQISAQKRSIKNSTTVQRPFNDRSTGVQRPFNDTDTYTDIKENNNPNGLLQKKEKRARQLPEDFGVTDTHRELAIKNNWPQPDSEIDAFRDHHVSKGNRMIDWDRAFYTWLRNSKKFKTNGENGNAKIKSNSGYPRYRSKTDILVESCMGAFDNLQSEKIINPKN